jgi:phage terminase Nu1 subunit (DNA packaging protein)
MKKAVVRDGKGHPKIDPEIADLEWRANTDPAKNPVPLTSEVVRESDPAVSRESEAYPDGIPAFEKSRARKEAFAAAMAELEYEKASGKLVEAKAVQKAVFETARMIRNAIQVLPDRVSPVVASMRDAHEVRAYLQSEVDGILVDLSARLREAPDDGEASPSD